MASSAFPLVYESTKLSANTIENGKVVGRSYEYIDGGFESVGGKNVPVSPVAKSDKVDKIIVVCNKDWIDYAKNCIKKLNVPKLYNITEGGETRSEIFSFSFNFGLKPAKGKNSTIATNQTYMIMYFNNSAYPWYRITCRRL